MQKFDSEAQTILDGFGITNDRRVELVGEYITGSRMDCISRIVNSELPENEKYMLCIELGVLLVGVVIDEMQARLPDGGKGMNIQQMMGMLGEKG